MVLPVSKYFSEYLCAKCAFVLQLNSSYLDCDRYEETIDFLTTRVCMTACVCVFFYISVHKKYRRKFFTTSSASFRIVLCSMPTFVLPKHPDKKNKLNNQINCYIFLCYMCVVFFQPTQKTWHFY